MKITVTTHGLESVRDLMKSLSGKQLAEATANALNVTGARVRRAMRGEFRRVFDRPTDYILRAPRYIPATPDKLAVVILPTAPEKGGKVGVDPQKILQAQEWGGRRADKKSEVLLRRANVLPAGYQTAIPADPYPGSDDGRGNIRGAFLQQLLSYMQTYSGPGTSGNMTAKRKSKLQQGRAAPGPMRPREQHRGHGRRYFVVNPTRRISRDRHLAPGIWAASGPAGGEVRPVLMFVRTPIYRPRLDMASVARTADVENFLPQKLRSFIKKAAGV